MHLILYVIWVLSLVLCKMRERESERERERLSERESKRYIEKENLSNVHQSLGCFFPQNVVGNKYMKAQTLNTS